MALLTSSGALARCYGNRPASVVAELCPLGYCTQSYTRLSARLGLTYLRWTNSIAENAKPGYDTIVDTNQFVELMRKALGAWRRGPSGIPEPDAGGPIVGVGGV